MDISYLFYGNISKFQNVVNDYKEQEKKILNNIKTKKIDYLKLSQSFRHAYSNEKLNK